MLQFVNIKWGDAVKRLARRHFLISASAVLMILLICYGATAGISTKPIGEEIPDTSVYSKNIHLFSNESAGFILASTDGNATKITYLSNEGCLSASSGITLDYAYSCAEAHNGEIYFAGPTKAAPDTAASGIDVSRYPLGKAENFFDASYKLSNIKNQVPQGITEDNNGNVYVLDSAAKNIFSVFSSGSSLPAATITGTHGDFASICVSPDSYLYITYSSGTKIAVANVKPGAPNKEPSLFSSDMPAIPYRFLSNSVAVDTNGTIFRVQGNPPVFHKVKDTGGTGDVACMLSTGEILCKTGSRTVGKFATDGTFLSEYKFDGDLLDLAANGTVAAAIVSQDSTIRFVDLSKPTTNGASSTPSESQPAYSSSSPTESTPSSGSTGGTGSSGIPSVSSSSANPDTSSEPLNPPAGSDPSAPESSGTGNLPNIPTSIKSTAYAIDRNEGLLYVNASTTFARLKSGIDMGSATLRAVKPNGTVLESGNIGTGTSIELRDNERVIDHLVAVVKGDFVGSGNLTSRDERLLYAHLNNGSSLSGVYLQAADIDNDGIVDTTDLLLLKRLVTASP